MLKKWMMIGCGVCSMVAFAQDTPSAARVVVYKWSQNGITHYSTHQPRGVGHVVKLDEQGLVIRDDSENRAIFEAMRPMRPEQQNTSAASAPTNNSNTSNSNSEESLPEGAIPKSERCANAQAEIATIQNAGPNQPINVEDAEGNLIPMTEEQKNARLQSAQALVDRLCN